MELILSLFYLIIWQEAVAYDKTLDSEYQEYLSKYYHLFYFIKKDY